MSSISNSMAACGSSIANLANLAKEQLPSTSQLMKNIKKVALPAIALYGACVVDKAKAGIILEIFCMAGCTTAAAVNPVAFLWYTQCLQFCAATGFLPTP